MQDGTESSPFFETNARELLGTLARHTSPEARKLEAEVRELIEVFLAWARARPEDGERVARINQLFALHRRVMELHTSGDPPAGREPLPF